MKSVQVNLKIWLYCFDKLTKLSKDEQHNKKACHYLEQVGLYLQPGPEPAHEEEYFWSSGICMRLYEELQGRW